MNRCWIKICFVGTACELALVSAVCASDAAWLKHDENKLCCMVWSVGSGVLRNSVKKTDSNVQSKWGSERWESPSTVQGQSPGGDLGAKSIEAEN